MIIGLDAKRIVRNGTGLGSYGRNLANDLAAIAPDDLQLRLYAPDAGRDDLRGQVAEGRHLYYVYPRHAWCKSLWRSHGIVSDLRSDRVDLFHGLSGELPIGIHRSGIRSVVTIHDLIFMRHPEYYHWADAQIYAWKFRRTIAEADRIIAISECTKRDIMYYGHVPQERIEVIYQSCSTHFKTRESEARLQDVHARYLLPGRYIIHVGTVERRKNILLAVKALAHIDSDVSIVIVGRQTPYADEVRAYAETHGLSGRVRWLTGVPNADLPSLYQMAEACVYPSRYEGFGVPVIEAIQSGLPVVACTGSCLEEAGGPDCLYVAPDDDQAMAQAITQVLAGAPGREERIVRSQAYIARFEGANVGAQVLDVYRRVAAGALK